MKWEPGLGHNWSSSYKWRQSCDQAHGLIPCTWETAGPQLLLCSVVLSRDEVLVHFFLPPFPIMKLNTNASFARASGARGAEESGCDRWCVTARAAFLSRPKMGANAQWAGGHGGFCRWWTAKVVLFKQPEIAINCSSWQGVRCCCKAAEAFEKQASRVKNTWFTNISVKWCFALQTTET